MSRLYQIGNHKTSIFTDDTGFTRVVYHETPVVSFNNDMIILDTGGYYTPTTKKRMNQASSQFNLGLHVYQRDFTWYIRYDGQELVFNKDIFILTRV